MHLDLILEPDLSPAEILELGLLAEGYGFRGIWIQNYSSARDALMSLVPLAQQSQLIQLGAVIFCPYEMHPMKIANSILTLNEYASGRAMIVIGAGGEWPEVMVSKVFETEYAKRMRNVREALEIVTKATSESEINYYGERYCAIRFSTAWHREKAPIIYHGACGHKMLAMGADIANGTMMSDMMPDMLGSRIETLRNRLKIAGKDREDYRISNFVAWHVRPDKQQSFAEARRELIVRGWLERDWLEPYLSPEDTKLILDNRWPFLQAWLRKSGKIEGVPRHITETLVEKLTLAGDLKDIDRHIARLKILESSGFTEIALRIHEQPVDSIRLIGERVLPTFESLQEAQAGAVSA